MARYLSWFCSIALHVGLAVLLFQAAVLPQPTLEDIIEVDLTEVETPAPITTLTAPPPAPLEVSADDTTPATPAVAEPLPMDKTVVLDDAPPDAALPDAADTAPAPEPAPVNLNPAKVTASLEKGVENPNRIVVRKNDTIVHRGHEARFGRSMMGDYFSYSSTEFSGQFTTKDDRTISIIDARNTKYGRFLIYDSKNKTLRRLKEFGKYVYTIGPSVHEDEPVVGTVTFLARNDRIERFILMTDDDRIAHYPRKVHVREKDVVIPTSQGTLRAYATLPPSGTGFPGTVFVHGNHCVEEGLIRGVTRALSARGLASLAPEPRMCGPDRAAMASDEQLVRDAAAAVDDLAAMPQIDAGRTGIWGNGAGVPFAIHAVVSHGEQRPGFLVCLLDDTVSPDRIPPQGELLQLTMPTLWLVTGHDTERWRPLIDALESLRDTDKRPFTIVVAPLRAGKEVGAARSANSGWVEQVAEDHARLAVSWINRVLPPAR